MGKVSPKKIAVVVCIGLVLVATIVLLATSFKSLQSYEVGLKYDTVMFELEETPTYEGLHTGSPGFKFIVFPNIYKTMSFANIKCLNQDGVKITLDIGYQFRLQAQNLTKIVYEFRDYDGLLKMMNSLAKSAIMDSCSTFNTSRFQSERVAFSADVLRRVTAKAASLSCEVTDLQVNNIARPNQYERAIREKESARENIQVATNERPRQMTAAITERREAETRAVITINRAETQARILVNRAETDAAAILNDFRREAEVYRELKETLSLDNDAFLSYMNTRALEGATNPVYISLDAPSKSTYLEL